MKLCRHCKHGSNCRPRGLCTPCSSDPEIRALYPSTHICARSGVGNFCGQGLPCEPTDALPGTPEKVAVLELRALLGQQLWHPLDAKGVAPKAEPAELKPERNAAMIRRRMAGATVRELMKEFGISENPVRRVLERRGVA